MESDFKSTAATPPHSDLDQALLDAARGARLLARSPYSDFRVGAAVRTRAGTIFVGCNIENAAFGASICAERVAIFSAIAAGHRVFSEIALVADQERPLTPCGTCRQVLSELAPGIRVIMANVNGSTSSATIEDLLPTPFALSP